MNDARPKCRLTDSLFGKIGAWLLAVAWLVGMATMDGNAYTALPMSVLCMAVLLIFLAGLLRGYKVVRMGLTAWFGLAVGVYYLVRCLCSYSVVESWGQAVLIIACMVFYVSGLYAAHGRLRTALATLVAAVVLNMTFLLLMKGTDLSMVWSGRPEVGLSGPNSRPTGLFYYKNFAGLFLMLSGGILLLRWIWAVRCRALYRWGGLLAVVSMIASCFCMTVSPLITGIVLFLGGWLLWYIEKMFSPTPPGIWAGAVSVLLLVIVVMGGYSLLFGDAFRFITTDLDTHLRTQIWGDLILVAQQAPWCGYGVGASQWEIVPVFEEWVSPNFAHNEYLQAWVDYGLVGALLMVALLLSHIATGLWLLTNEGVDAERRHMTCMALLVVVVFAVGAISDYVWHHAALATMTAFACGILASPFRHAPLHLLSRCRWSEGSHPASVPVRSAGAVMRWVLGSAAVVLIVLLGWVGLHFVGPWFSQWQCPPACMQQTAWQQQCRLIEEQLDDYPDFALMNYYTRLTHYHPKDWEKRAFMLNTTLHANPRNLYNVEMLAGALSQCGRYADAERLLRRMYAGDGPNPTILTSWHVCYGMNLLRWGQSDFRQGRPEAALSKLRYALRIHQLSPLFLNTQYRADRMWKESRSEEALRTYLTSCSELCHLLEMLGIMPDDSWMQPMEDGGKPSLYRRWGLPPEQQGNTAPGSGLQKK